MKQSLISVPDAVMHGARLSQVNLISYYRTPFTTDILDLMYNLQAANIDSDSFSSALSSAIGGSLCSMRAMVISSRASYEDVSFAAFARLPICIVNISGSGGVFSIRHDHTDVMNLSNTGTMIFMPQSPLEVVESIIQGYRICEDHKVLLPFVVNIDILKISETVQLPGGTYVKRFLPHLSLPFRFGKKPMYFFVPQDNYSELRKQQQKALKNALHLIESTSALWEKNFKHGLGAIDCYKTEDADLIIVIAGFHSSTAKVACDAMRKEGKKTGVVRLRVLRPWPFEDLKSALKNAKKIAVFDQAVSFGSFGALYRDVKMLHPFCLDFTSLEKHPDENDFISIFDHLDKSTKEEVIWL